MYERSAIVLERYLNKLFGFDKVSNLRENFYHFSELIEDLKEYQTMVSEEEKVINKFDEIAKEIQEIQKAQEKLSISNQKLEDERNKLFNALDENPNTIQGKMEKIEKMVDDNNLELKRLREEYIKTFVIFIERQKERNKFARGKRGTETKYLTSMKEAKEKFKYVSVQDMQNMKRFVSGNKTDLKNGIIDIMIKNGKSEKIGFNKEVINKAVDVRISIAEKEAECYMTCYDRFRKLLTEIDNDSIRLDRYEKFSKDNSVKLAFLNAEKEYVIDFLDNERMTVIGGPIAHKKMMEEACKNFDVDISQIENLYELILREIAGKSTKKAYNELYNKTYLRDIQAKERGFEAEATNIKINLGTVINSNYWRIEGMKNIYEVFIREVTEKFEKDLSDYKVEEIEIMNQIEDITQTKQGLKKENTNSIMNNSLYSYNKYNEKDNDFNYDFEEETSKMDDENGEEDIFSSDEYDNEDYFDNEYENDDDEYYENDEENYQEEDEYSDYNNEEDEYQNDEYEEYDDEYNEYDDSEENNYDDNDEDDEYDSNDEDDSQEDEGEDNYYDNYSNDEYDENDYNNEENEKNNSEFKNPSYKSSYDTYQENYNKYIKNSEYEDMEYDNIYASIISDANNSYRGIKRTTRKKDYHPKRVKQSSSKNQRLKKDKKYEENKGIFDMLFKKNDD